MRTLPFKNSYFFTFFRMILNNVLLYSTDDSNFGVEKVYFFIITFPYYGARRGKKMALGRPYMGNSHKFFDLAFHFTWFGNFLEGFKKYGNSLFLTNPLLIR